jgi:chromosome segregation ATPase
MGKLTELGPRRASTERTIQELRAELSKKSAQLDNLDAELTDQMRSKDRAYGLGLAMICFTAGFLLGVAFAHL